MEDAQQPRNSGRHLAGLITTWVFALIPANLVPTIIGRLVGDFGVDLTLAGLVATGMTLANAAAVLALRSVAERGYRKLLARAGALLLMIPLIVGVITMDATVIMVALVIGGFGSGMVIAASTAAVSAAGNPDSATNAVMIVNRLVVALIFFSIPIIGGGMHTVMVLTLVPGAVALAGSQWLPKAPAEEAARTVEAGGEEPFAQTTLLFAQQGTRQLRRYGWVFALAWGVWSVTDDGVFGLVEVLAADNVEGAGADYAAFLLGCSILAGMVGTLISRPVMKAMGRPAALGTMLMLSLLSKIGLSVGGGEILFFTAGCLWGFAFGATLPIVFGFAARMERNGSISVLVNGVYIVGVALGPLLATQIYSLAGSGVLAAVMTVLAAVSAVFMVYITMLARAGEHENTNEKEQVHA